MYRSTLYGDPILLNNPLHRARDTPLNIACMISQCLHITVLPLGVVFVLLRSVHEHLLPVQVEP
jgi:hypothetical protein